MNSRLVERPSSWPTIIYKPHTLIVTKSRSMYIYKCITCVVFAGASLQNIKTRAWSSWKKNIINPFENQQLDILLSGPIPPNALNLLNNGNIDILIKEARAIYDYIIIDSAPTLLVADTKSIIDKSDILIYLTRCNITDKNILNHKHVLAILP